MLDVLENFFYTERHDITASISQNVIIFVFLTFNSISSLLAHFTIL